MSDKTNIAWTESTWNPWYGCTKVSAGCDNCYMFRQMRQYGRDPEIVQRSKTKFTEPLKWKEPRRVFTCSWSDWFHKDADAWRDEAWAIIKATPQHTYQILTKRPGRIARHLPADWDDGYPNVWLGVSIESQEQAFRALQLAAIPAHIRFISAEPLVGPLGFRDYCGPIQEVLQHVHWLIVGGESGPDGVRRDMDLAWARSLQRECKDSGTAFFFKQRSGRTPELVDGVPADLLVREWPHTALQIEPVR
jgi:protein gp37